MNFILGDENLLFCHHCDLSFLQESEYLSHLKVHEKEFVFNFRCNFCEYKSNCPNDFKKHSQVHFLKNYKFSCNLCEYKTNRHADLKRHSFVHSQERPFVCSVCGKAFNQKANLRTHMLSVHCKTF